MKVLGFLMLLAGWFLVLAAIVLFAAPPLRAAFVLAGMAVEDLGLILAFRSHLNPREEKE
jgi:Flp pilus assembly protein TadB